jgi:hypothetical protein
VNTKESTKLDLEESFAFLLSKGFRISSFEYHEESFGNWEMTFQSRHCIMQVYRERYGDIGVVLKPVGASEDRWYGLGTLVYFISEGKDYIGLFGGEWSDEKGQIDRLAGILYQYFDDILSLFEKDFKPTASAIQGLHKVLLDLNREEYRKRETKYGRI